jgi:hypothetical protein
VYYPRYMAKLEIFEKYQRAATNFAEFRDLHRSWLRDTDPEYLLVIGAFNLVESLFRQLHQSCEIETVSLDREFFAGSDQREVYLHRAALECRTKKCKVEPKRSVTRPYLESEWF